LHTCATQLTNTNTQKIPRPHHRRNTRGPQPRTTISTLRATHENTHSPLPSTSQQGCRVEHTRVTHGLGGRDANGSTQNKGRGCRALHSESPSRLAIALVAGDLLYRRGRRNPRCRRQDVGRVDVYAGWILRSRAPARSEPTLSYLCRGAQFNIAAAAIPCNGSHLATHAPCCDGVDVDCEPRLGRCAVLIVSGC
jgi:hypothetical protein